MARIKMLDTTRHKDYGAMLEGTVHEVDDADAERFVRLRLAQKTTAKTTAEVEEARRAAEEGGAEPLAEGELELPARLDEEAPAPRAPASISRGDVAGLTGEAAPRGARR